MYTSSGYSAPMPRPPQRNANPYGAPPPGGYAPGKDPAAYADPDSMFAISNMMRPNFVSMADELKKTQAADSGGYNALKGEALRKGPSQWLAMSEFQNALKGADAKEKGLQENAGQTAKARDQLAASGGLSSGARERVEEQGQRNYMSMAQDLSRQNTLADLGMNVQDESNRLGAVKDLTTTEEQKQQDWLNAKKSDYSNELSIYQAQMEGIAAEKQANATANAGKK